MNSEVLPYDTPTVANQIIDVAHANGQHMSIIRLLKFTYLTHGWTLAVADEPLVNEFVQAWDNGPVIPSIYYAFRPYGVYRLPKLPVAKNMPIDDEINHLMESVYGLYKHLNESQLSALTDIRGGPWQVTYRRNKPNVVIPNELISKHFKSKLERAETESS